MQVKPPRIVCSDEGEYKSKPFIDVDAPSGDWVNRDEKGYYFEIAFIDRRLKVYIVENEGSKK